MKMFQLVCIARVPHKCEKCKFAFSAVFSSFQQFFGFLKSRASTGPPGPDDWDTSMSLTQTVFFLWPIMMWWLETWKAVDTLSMFSLLHAAACDQNMEIHSLCFLSYMLQHVIPIAIACHHYLSYWLLHARSSQRKWKILNSCRGFWVGIVSNHTGINLLSRASKIPFNLNCALRVFLITLPLLTLAEVRFCPGN